MVSVNRWVRGRQGPYFVRAGVDWYAEANSLDSQGVTVKYVDETEETEAGRMIQEALESNTGKSS